MITDTSASIMQYIFPNDHTVKLTPLKNYLLNMKLLDLFILLYRIISACPERLRYGNPEYI